MKEEDKYDYGRNDLWNKIQYLPDKLKIYIFYEPMLTSSYEKTLAQNLEKLRKISRTKNLAQLKRNYPIIKSQIPLDSLFSYQNL